MLIQAKFGQEEKKKKLDYDFWGEGDVRGIGLIYLLLENSDICFSLTFLIQFYIKLFCFVALHKCFLLGMPVCLWYLNLRGYIKYFTEAHLTA